MEFDQSYIEKTYLFARARTNSVADAQDLAQDILTEVLNALQKGAQPKHFSAWFWTIARRRYARFVEQERLYRLSGQIFPSQQDCSDIALLQERLAKDDALKIIYRELSLLTKIYREIVILHYIEGKTVTQIATELKIPAGTVKRRLHDARLIIRRGVKKMNRLTGKRSFRPDKLMLSASGSPGKAWPYLRRQLPKNILSIAAQRPATVDELCAEIGLARPYMEEEVELLEEITLLRKVSKSAYQTDFIILNRSIVAEIETNVASKSKDLAAKVYEALDNAKSELLNTGFFGNNLEWKFLSWIFILKLADQLIDTVKSDAQKTVETKDRPLYEKPWYFSGIRELGQSYENSIPFYGCNGVFHNLRDQDIVTHAVSYSIEDFIPPRLNEFDTDAIDIALKIAFHKLLVSQLTEDQKEILAELITKNIVVNNDGNFLLNIPVFGAGHNSRITTIIRKIIHPFVEQTSILWSELYAKLELQIDRHLHNQIHNYLSGIFGNNLRHYFVEYGLENNLLSTPVSSQLPLEGLWITYGDSFIEKKLFSVLDKCTEQLKVYELPISNLAQLSNHLKASMEIVTKTPVAPSEALQKNRFRLGGRIYKLKDVQTIYNLSSGSIDIWIAEFSNLDQALTNLNIKNHIYTGRSITKTPDQIIWVAWCMVNEGVNSCFALSNLDRFLISINVNTNIPSEVFQNNDWDRIVGHPEVKSKLRTSTELLEKLVQELTGSKKS